MIKLSQDESAESILLSAVIEHCQEIITIKDLNYRYLTCNKAFLKHIDGLSREEIIGKTIFDIIPQVNADCMRLNIDKSIKTKTPQTYTMKINYSGVSKIVQQTSTPIINNGTVEYILSISRDITEDEKLKEELLRKNGQLNTLLAYVPALVYMKDKDKNYIIGSKYAKDFVTFGYDAHADNIQIDMNKAKNDTDEEDDYVLNSKNLLYKEKSAVDYDGNYHWYNILKAPIFTSDNAIDGLITIARNIDNQKALENQKDLFIATLVHDLKNPLLAQICCINQCCSGLFGELNETQKEILSTTLESANYMKDMLYTLINTYKYDNGNIQLKKSRTDIDMLLKTCINEQQSFAKEQKVTLVYNSNLEDDDKYVMIDEKQLRRVITNLLNNGINYAFADTNFKLKTEIKNDILIISMENTSPPIDAETEKHLFEKYISGSGRFQKAGFGLGLYLSKKILEAHDGKIYHTGKGTLNSFIMELPVNSTKNTANIVW